MNETKRDRTKKKIKTKKFDYHTTVQPFRADQIFQHKLNNESLT